MEYAKDENFIITYNTTLNRVRVKPLGWTSKIRRFIKNNKFIVSVLSTFLAFSIIDIALIYSFMNILKNL